MTGPKLALILIVACALALAGCQDRRRDAVRDWLQSHPPEGFAVVDIPGDFVFANTPDGGGETVVRARYRLEQPTVAVQDVFTLPRGAGIAKRLTAVRSWALASLPAGDPTREAIISAVAKARASFPVKSVVTPRGTEVESSVVLKLHKKGDAWQVIPEVFDVTLPGDPDRNSRIPFRDSPSAVAKLDELEALAGWLEESRRTAIAERRRIAERSKAALLSRLRTGNTFEGHLSDGTTIRLVVTRGTETSGPTSIVISLQRSAFSSAKYVGGWSQEPSGETVWRAAQVTSLSGRGDDLVTDERVHPILTLKAAEKGLSVEAKSFSHQILSLVLLPAGSLDLIPEESPQVSDGQ